MLCVDDGRGDGLVVVLFCRVSDSFEEDLCCGPKLGVFVDLVELDEVGLTLLKIVEALIGAFFSPTNVELNTNGAGGGGGGGGSGREIMDSNTYLLSMLIPKHFLAVSAICFPRSDLACTCFSGRFLVQSCGRAT